MNFQERLAQNRAQLAQQEKAKMQAYVDADAKRREDLGLNAPYPSDYTEESYGGTGEPNSINEVTNLENSELKSQVKALRVVNQESIKLNRSSREKLECYLSDANDALVHNIRKLPTYCDSLSRNRQVSDKQRDYLGKLKSVTQFLNTRYVGGNSVDWVKLVSDLDLERSGLFTVNMLRILLADDRVESLIDAIISGNWVSTEIDTLYVIHATFSKMG